MEEWKHTNDDVSIVFRDRGTPRFNLPISQVTLMERQSAVSIILQWMRESDERVFIFR